MWRFYINDVEFYIYLCYNYGNRVTRKSDELYCEVEFSQADGLDAWGGGDYYCIRNDEWIK